MVTKRLFSCKPIVFHLNPSLKAEFDKVEHLSNGPHARALEIRGGHLACQYSQLRAGCRVLAMLEATNEQIHIPAVLHADLLPRLYVNTHLDVGR